MAELSSIQSKNLASSNSLQDAFQLLKKEIFLDLNCHHVGTIQAFNSERQQVTVRINYKRTQFNTDENGKQVRVLYDYPLLFECPIIILSGGSTSLTFPIESGDECLLLFNDRDLDTWLTSGSVENAPPTAQLHSFSDAIALIGVRSFARPINDYDAVRALLTNGNVRLGINPTNNRVLIENDSRNLNDLLQDLIDAIADITVSGIETGGSVSGPPVNAAAITAIGVQIAQLLE